MYCGDSTLAVTASDDVEIGERVGHASKTTPAEDDLFLAILLPSPRAQPWPEIPQGASPVELHSCDTLALGRSSLLAEPGCVARPITCRSLPKQE